MPPEPFNFSEQPSKLSNLRGKAESLCSKSQTFSTLRFGYRIVNNTAICAKEVNMTKGAFTPDRDTRFSAWNAVVAHSHRTRLPAPSWVTFLSKVAAGNFAATSIMSPLHQKAGAEKLLYKVSRGQIFLRFSRRSYNTTLSQKSRSFLIGQLRISTSPILCFYLAIRENQTSWDPKSENWKVELGTILGQFRKLL
jgi:hypothetical protein